MAEDQTLRVHAFFRPPTFDPTRQATGARGGNGLGRQYTEPLLKPEGGVVDPKKLDVVGAAAADYETSSDGLTYTFHLREDGKFNDGQPVRAADFVYGWRRVIDPRVGAPFATVFANAIKGGDRVMALPADASDEKAEAALGDLGLKAVDDFTFRVTLAHPAVYFKWIATLHQGAPIRRDVVEEHGSDTWANKANTLVTNGPFKVAEMGLNQATLIANPYHWDKPLLEKIVATFDTQAGANWVAYLNDKMGVSNGPPLPHAYASEMNNPERKDELLQYLELSNNWLQFNASNPPFDNPDVRRAFAQAIDRKGYLGEWDGVFARSLTTLIPDGIAGHNPDLGRAQEFDPGGARATLDSSGVETANFEDVKILTSPAQEADALVFADDIKQHLGISVGIDVVGDTATLAERVRKGKYHLKTTFQGHAALYPDPQDFFHVFLSNSGQNESRWKNREYDRLVKQADGTTDHATRMALYDQAHAILVEEAPVAFIAQLYRIFWVKPWVRGVTRTPVDTAFLPGDLHSNKIWIAKH